MTTFGKVDLLCPCCGVAFQGYELYSTNNFGGQKTDFHSLAVGFDPLYYTISTCPDCGFTDYSGAWPTSGSLKPGTCDRVRSEITPLAGGDRLDGSLRFRFLGLIAEWEGREARIVADQYLKAAWLATAEGGHTDIEVSCRRLAIGFFEKALATIDQSDDEYLALTYLVGELYRRVGERDRANEWFDRVIARTNVQDASPVAQAARQQRTDPKEFFGDFMQKRR